MYNTLHGYLYRMTLRDAIDLIRPGVFPLSGTWADIGAGTGMFTMALMEILVQGKILAVDKNPHALYKSDLPKQKSKVPVEIIEADFNKSLSLPLLDGLIMANALHYALDHLLALQNVLSSLKVGGTILLIEYETHIPRAPWVPNPVPFQHFAQMCTVVGLNPPKCIGKHNSIYGHEHMYVASSTKA